MNVIRAVAAAAALVLAMGLPRLLVLCRHGGESSLEFTHPHGACCQHGGPAGDREPDRSPSTGPLEECEHTSLAVELAPTPRPDRAAPTDLPPLVGWLPPGLPRAALPQGCFVHPPSTGPPRRDRVTALHRTSLLLI